MINWQSYVSKFSDCDTLGPCNTYGTMFCRGVDGISCAKCKPGYMGNRCQYCQSEDLIISGTNGIILNNGQGVKCSKSLFQI